MSSNFFTVCLTLYTHTQFSLLFYSFFLLATLSLKNSLFSHSVLCDNNYDSKCARQKRGRKICLTSTCWMFFVEKKVRLLKGMCRGVTGGDGRQSGWWTIEPECWAENMFVPEKMDPGHLRQRVVLCSWRQVAVEAWECVDRWLGVA